VADDAQPVFADCVEEGSLSVDVDLVKAEPVAEEELGALFLAWVEAGVPSRQT
jgi:hypothetical protein